MSIFKCKMCGGDLRVSEDSKIAECEYCGTTQTVPNGDDEKKANLFNRANRLRMENEFDKAAGIYESIVSEYPEESEGYWGLVLCAFGIEYVDDAKTGKKIPTCHRTVTSSVMDDDNFAQACENANTTARAVYREEAKEIDKLQKKIISVVEGEEPYDVFICYKETDDVTRVRTEDSLIAQDIYTELVKEGYKVFFSRVTLREKAGTEYEPYIYAALKSSKVMLAIGTKYEYYDAVWVKNEWGRYLSMMNEDNEKHLIPCFKNLDAYDIPKEFKNLQALDMGDVTFFKNLIDNITRFVPKKAEKGTSVSGGTTAVSASAIEPLLKRAFMFLEDGDWNSANEYCEKVLDIDPENTKAYIGKLCVEYELKNLSEIKEGTIYGKLSEAEKFVLKFIDNMDISLAVREYRMVTGLGEKEAKEAIRALRERLDNPTDILSSKYYLRISQFGDQKTTSEIKEYAEHGRIEDIYKHAKIILEKAENENDCKNASKIFLTISEYKDSTVLASRCLEKADEINRKNAEDERRKIEEEQRKIEAENQKIELAKTKAIKDKHECAKLIDELKSYYVNKRYGEVQKNETKKQITFFTNHLNELSDLKNNWSDLEQKNKLLDAQIKENQSELEKLNTEKSNLNFFDFKSKKQLNKKISELKSDIESLEEETKKIIAIRKGYSTHDQLSKKISSVKNELSIATQKLDNLSKSRTEKQILDDLNAYEDGLKFATELQQVMKAKIGDIITWGSYPQEVERKEFRNGKYVPVSYKTEDIEWIVLDINNDKILVTSKHIIDRMSYNYKSTPVTWEECDLRKWLNDKFLNTAFTEDEIKMISTSKLSNHSNPKYITFAGNDTFDKVFLLSCIEVEKYFSSNFKRICHATDYAKRGETSYFKNNARFWLLRSPGADFKKVAPVDFDGEICPYSVHVWDLIGIRPAMWIDLNP